MRFIFLLLLISCSDDATFTSITHNVNANISGKLHSEFLTPDSRNSNNLDILLVIDSSESMAEERTTLSNKLSPLLSEVQDRNWQIAITTTNSSKKCLESLITKDTSNYQSLYQKTIDGIKSESSSEQAIKMVIESLRGLPVCGQQNDSSTSTFWLQDQSMLAILIITDEDHQCSEMVKGQGCNLQDLYNFLEVAGRTLNLTTKVYGFLNPNKNSKFLAPIAGDVESIFTRHEPLEADQTDYDSVLRQISQQLASGMQFTFDLTEKHDGEASEVVIYFDDDERILDQGEYGFIDDKLIIISRIPENTDRIKATYSYKP